MYQPRFVPASLDQCRLATASRCPYNSRAMYSSSPDQRQAILERVFPELRYGGDPDIERYFDLRAQGRVLDALGIYRQRLVPRYPDQKQRILLLQLYRRNSGQFSNLLREVLLARADEITERIRQNIDTLYSWLEQVDQKDTYAVLKAMERTVHLLPEGQDRAKDFVRNYLEYSQILGHRQPEMERLHFLLDEFYAQTETVQGRAVDFLAMSQATEQARQAQRQEAEASNFFDVAKINFDQNDVQRITIPEGIERNEDQALAYCYKYWLRVQDSAFERVVWLYSKKYATKHYDIFRTIKIGRQRRYNDDEILSLVSSSLTTQYAYTVRGDLYMQQQWRALKAHLLAGGRSPFQTPEQAVEPAPRTPPGKPGGRKEKKQNTSKKAVQPRPGRKQDGPGQAKIHLSQPAARPAAINTAPRPQAQHASMPQRLARGSVSDQIKRLSGRAYDVYRDLFMARLRASIREHLAKNRTKAGSLFNDNYNQAENLVYGFIDKNYYNAYMDWTGGEEYQQLERLGFRLTSLEPLVEHCFRRIHG